MLQKKQKQKQKPTELWEVVSPPLVTCARALLHDALSTPHTVRGKDKNYEHQDVIENKGLSLASA